MKWQPEISIIKGNWSSNFKVDHKLKFKQRIYFLVLLRKLTPLKATPENFLYIRDQKVGMSEKKLSSNSKKDFSTSFWSHEYTGEKHLESDNHVEIL